MKIAKAALISMLLFSCSFDNKKESSKQIINPNGDSELALAMRKIFDQTNEIKNSLEVGNLVIPKNYIENLRYFHTAIPTDPEVKVEEFYGFVNAIDLLASSFETKEKLEDQKAHYSKVINTCIQCHKTFCPGPIRRINKLKLLKK